MRKYLQKDSQHCAMVTQKPCDICGIYIGKPNLTRTGHCGEGNGSDAWHALHGEHSAPHHMLGTSVHPEHPHRV